MSSNAWRKLLRISALTAVLAVSVTRAGGLDAALSFEIAAQPLDSALLEFSRYTGIQVISAAVDVSGKQTSGVRGSHTARAALDRLLQGSSLTFIVTGESSVSITNDKGS